MTAHSTPRSAAHSTATSTATSKPQGGLRRAWPALRLVAGVVVLGALVWRFGTGPFADAWHVTTWGAVLAALLLNVPATLANAWRWRVVGRALGVPLTVRGSVAAYYRSQFLNVTLPGGMLGDAHRAVRHGRHAGDLGVGVRATLWDRVAGQASQSVLLVGAVLVLPSPLHRFAPLGLAGLAGLALLTWWLARPSDSSAFVGRDLRTLARPSTAARVGVASLVSTAANVAVFLVAAAAVGVDAGPAVLLTVALVVLAGAAVPLNVAGWGPREGVTAGVFTLVGLGSQTGLTVSVVFGVLAAVATVPGLVVLAADAVVRRSTAPTRATRELEEARRG
jgi:glycosyltransferase 2 family protein